MPSCKNPTKQNIPEKRGKPKQSREREEKRDVSVGHWLEGGQAGKEGEEASIFESSQFKSSHAYRAYHKY